MAARAFRTVGVVAALLGASTLAVACRNEGRTDVPATTTTTSARLVSSDEAVMRLTNVRCDREVACNFVGLGAGKRFADRDTCNRMLGLDVQAAVGAEICPRGVHEARLSACLSDAREERCDAAIDTVEALPSCRRSELCPRD